MPKQPEVAGFPGWGSGGPVVVKSSLHAFRDAVVCPVRVQKVFIDQAMRFGLCESCLVASLIAVSDVPQE